MDPNGQSVEGMDWDPYGERLILLSLETFKILNAKKLPLLCPGIPSTSTPGQNTVGFFMITILSDPCLEP